MKATTLILHDESGTTSGSGVFSHTIAFIHREDLTSFSDAEARIREKSRFQGIVKWSRYSSERRTFRCEAYVNGFLDWFYSTGHSIVQFCTVIFDQSSPLWDVSLAPQKHHLYNYSLRQSVNFAKSYMDYPGKDSHQPIQAEMYSDWRRRHTADNFTEYLPKILSAEVGIQLANPIVLLGRNQNYSGQLEWMAERALPLVDFVAGASRSTYLANIPLCPRKERIVATLSSWLQDIRPLKPAQSGQLKRKFEVIAKPSPRLIHRDFLLPHVGKTATSSHSRDSSAPSSGNRLGRGSFRPQPHRARGKQRSAQAARTTKPGQSKLLSAGSGESERLAFGIE